jgi:hypothetical protein
VNALGDKSDGQGSNSHGRNGRGRAWGLLAILAGIAFGAIFGVVYGRSMWLASGGPERKLDVLNKTVA